jgi:hypothetical protein
MGFDAWADAATVNLAWSPNTVDKDLAKVNVYQAPGTCAVPGPFAVVTTFAPTAVTGSVTESADGTYCIKITYVDTASNESLFSNSVEAVVNTVPPVAPSGLSVVSVKP